MNHKFGAIYHILLKFQYATWTINPFKGHLVLKGLPAQGLVKDDVPCKSAQ